MDGGSAAPLKSNLKKQGDGANGGEAVSNGVAAAAAIVANGSSGGGDNKKVHFNKFATVQMME